MDDEEFGTLLVAHRAMLLGVAAGFVGFEEAEDAVNDTFALAWRDRARFDGRAPGGWLATICRHRCIDITRRRRFVTVALDHLPERADPAREPEAAALCAAVGEAIVMALAQLRDEQVDAVLLCERDGRDLHEAATMLGVPLGTIKSRLSRGRVRLRALLAGWG